jgi:hypothetical protein
MSDITQARADLVRHVDEIRLVPQLKAKGIAYLAVGEWDLLGNQREADRARNLFGVDAR